MVELGLSLNVGEARVIPFLLISNKPCVLTVRTRGTELEEEVSFVIAKQIPKTLPLHQSSQPLVS
jgi:hypothetical protein